MLLPLLQLLYTSEKQFIKGERMIYSSRQIISFPSKCNQIRSLLTIAHRADNITSEIVMNDEVT